MGEKAYTVHLKREKKHLFCHSIQKNLFIWFVTADKINKEM